MRSHFRRDTTARFLLATSIAVVVYVTSTPTLGRAADSYKTRVSAARAQLDGWLGNDPNAAGWRQFLLLDELDRQLGASAADPDLVGRVLSRFESAGGSLNLPAVNRLRRAVDAWIDHLMGAADGGESLASAIRAAKEKFITTSPEDLAKVQQQADVALASLDTFLNRATDKGKGWRQFFDWDRLRKGVRAGTLEDVRALATLRQRFTGGQAGLDHPLFDAVRQQLAVLASKSRVAVDPRSRQLFEGYLEALALRIEALAKDPSSRDRLRREAGIALGWLEDYGQAPALVARTRHRLSRPNLHLAVSQRFLTSGLGNSVSRTLPVRDNIMGTSICGTGDTKGQLTIQLVPSYDGAQFDYVFAGNVASKTLGVNGPARIWSNSNTRIDARKRVILDDRGVRDLPAVAHARTSARITGIGSSSPGLRGRIVRRVATKRAGQQRGQSERVAAQHAEVRFGHEMDREAQSQLVLTNRGLDERMRRPLMRHGQYPSRFEFASSSNQLLVLGLIAASNQLAAPNAAPDFGDASSDLVVRAHHSMPNNLAYTLLAGQTLDKDRMEAMLIDLVGTVPEEFKKDNDREPWSITFDAQEPVVFRFDQNKLDIMVKGTRYTSGDGAFGAMNVGATYTLGRDASGNAQLERGELSILPPGFDPASGRKLGIRQTTLRNMLKRRFDKLFKPQIQLGGVPLPARFSKLGVLDLSELVLDRGWIALAWKSTAGPKTAATAERKVTGSALAASPFWLSLLTSTIPPL